MANARYWAINLSFSATLAAAVALAALGHPAAALIAPGDPSTASALTLFTVALTYALAIGVLKGLRKLGISVPAEVSIVGFDNIVYDELVEPALTTVAAPLYRMGFTGVQMANVGCGTGRFVMDRLERRKPRHRLKR